MTMIRITFKTVLALAAVAAMAFSFSGCYLMPRDISFPSPPVIPTENVQYTTYTVVKGNLENRTNDTATIEAANTAALFFNCDGILKEFYVESGQEVKKGDLLAELEYPREEEIAFELYKIDYQKQKKDLEAQIRAATDSNTKKQLQLSLELLEIEYNRRAEPFVNGKIYAPFDGTILSTDKRQIESNGNLIAAKQIIMQIADISKLQLRVEGSGMELYKVNMEVEVKPLKTSGDKPPVYKGKVVQEAVLGPNGQVTGYVLIDVIDLDWSKVTRDTAFNVSYLVDKKDGILFVPNACIKTYEDGVYVAVLDAKGKKQEIKVEVGMASKEYIEILSGVKAGDKVIIR